MLAKGRKIRDINKQVIINVPGKRGERNGKILGD